MLLLHQGSRPRSLLQYPYRLWLFTIYILRDNLSQRMHRKPVANVLSRRHTCICGYFKIVHDNMEWMGGSDAMVVIPTIVQNFSNTDNSHYTVVSEPTLILTNVYVIIALENQITVFMLIITYSINSAVHFFFTSSFK
ncbi:Hypothetical_protein [Hexamita inflata]|uniref:Hypothetical_protein n=1 Tax=Hexamita inflata TaxID=28002 RepID=A0AA86UNG1_9EUKA|nr:Hypothetical protein HINF_LOCUS52950 [Hexamita inflata]